MVIVNSPLRGNIVPSKWGLIKSKLITNGGTWSKDPLQYADDADLALLGSKGYEMIYSICLARTPAQEVAELTRYKAHGLIIKKSRLGNEEDADVKLNDVPKNKCFPKGMEEANSYTIRAKGHKEAIRAAFPDMEFILTAPFPSNEQGERYTLFRQGWCARIHEEPIPIGVDMHVYDRCGPIPISLDLMPDFEGRKRYFIEVGAIHAGDNALWFERTKRVMLLMKPFMRLGDTLGIQSMDNANGTALLHGGNITALGQWFNEQDWRTVDDVIDKLPFSPLYKFLILKMDDGTEVGWKGWFNASPERGTFYA